MSTSIMRTILTNLKTLIEGEFLDVADEVRIREVRITPTFIVPTIYPAVQLTDGNSEDDQDNAQSSVYLTVISKDPDPEDGMLDLLDLTTDLKQFIEERFDRLCGGVHDYDSWSSDPMFGEVSPTTAGGAVTVPVIQWRTLRFTPIWLED